MGGGFQCGVWEILLGGEGRPIEQPGDRSPATRTPRASQMTRPGRASSKHRSLQFSPVGQVTGRNIVTWACLTERGKSKKRCGYPFGFQARVFFTKGHARIGRSCRPQISCFPKSGLKWDTSANQPGVVHPCTKQEPTKFRVVLRGRS